MCHFCCLWYDIDENNLTYMDLIINMITVKQCFVVKIFICLWKIKGKNLYKLNYRMLYMILYTFYL